MTVAAPRRRLADRDGALAWIFLLPSVVYIVALVAVPFFLAISFSVSDVTAGDPSYDFVGLRNFRAVFDDPVFWRSLGNTLLLWALGVGFSPTFALVILCMAAAASILPITAGGAIVGVGATSGVLLALGVPTREAVNYAVASGLLLTCSALVAAMIGVCGSILFASRGGHLVRAEPA